MKIAVLLYGHLRDFEKCADALNENLLSIFDCDVFIHTWDKIDHNSKSWHEQRFDALEVDEKVIDIIRSKYHPKDLIVEHQEKYVDETIIEMPYNPELKISSAIPHFLFYSMNKANQMRLKYERENKVSYDYLLVTRPDVRLKKTFDVNNIINWIEVLGYDMSKCRFFAPFKSVNPKWFITSTSNDLLFFAKPCVIDKYIEVNKYLSKDEVAKYGITMLSIFTAKEIRNGIMPIPLNYMMSDDWDYSNMRIQPIIQDPRPPIKTWKKALFGIGAVLLYPFAVLEKKHSMFNYYEFRKELGR